jgi:hypothetical protein
MITGRRLPVVVVLAALLIAAVGAGDRTTRAGVGVTVAAVAASAPAAGVESSVWYCSGGPVSRGPSGDQVTISNVGSAAVRVAIDVLVAERDVAEQFVSVAARSSTTTAVARLSSAPSAAVVVQPFGGDVVVEQGFSVNGDVAMAPCATRASSSWYFAAGSSVSGTQTWLSLLNPFAVDAVVDVEAYSEDGLLAPGSLQGLDVPADSRLAVRIDQTVAEQRIVAVSVQARAGSQVVATQSVIQSRPPASSASLSLGALAPARTWMFADNRSQADSVQQLVLADPGDVDATARVSVVADVATVIEPRVVHVPATTAVTVDFSSVVPAGVAYTLVVDSAVPVVAETRDAYGVGFPGLVTEVGSPVAARRWSFAGGPFTATGLGGGGPRVPDGYQLAVVMNVDATVKQVEDMYTTLAGNSHVAGFHVVKQDAALRIFRASQRDNPALLASVTSDMLPVSFDVQATSDAVVATLGSRLRLRAGVASVVSLANEAPAVADDVVVLNPGTRPARVSVLPTAGGATLPGPGTTDVVVGPGGQVTISLVTLERTGAAAVVDATAPVVAERFTAGPFGVTRSPGVPWLHV